MNNSTKEILRIASLFIWTGFIAGLVVFGLFLFKAVEQEDYMTKSMFYFGFGALFLFAVVGQGIISFLVMTGKLSYQKWGWANLFLFDPEEDSLLQGTPLVKYLTFTNVLNLSLMFALGISLFSTLTNTFFTALPNTEYQITETGKLILATEPAAFTETCFMAFFLGLFTGWSNWYVRTRKLSSSFRFVLYLLIAIMCMLIWTGIHLARYGSTETNLLATAFFGFGGALISLLNGSLLTWYLWHFFGNLFNKASELFSNDVVGPIIVLILVLYIIIFVSVKILGKKLKSRRI